MNIFRRFMFAMAAALPLISVVLIAVAWLRVNDMAPPVWFVPHLVLTDAMPGVLIPANAPLNASFIPGGGELQRSAKR